MCSCVCLCLVPLKASGTYSHFSAVYGRAISGRMHGHPRGRRAPSSLRLRATGNEAPLGGAAAPPHVHPLTSGAGRGHGTVHQPRGAKIGEGGERCQDGVKCRWCRGVRSGSACRCLKSYQINYKISPRSASTVICCWLLLLRRLDSGVLCGSEE